MKILYLKLVNFKRFPLRDIEIFEHHFKSKLLMVTGPNGCGKAQPLNSFIKVPNGWDLMGNMKIGTEVIAKDGTITKVKGVFPQGKKEIFKLTFKDGRTTRATSDHLWKVYLSNYYPIKPKILTTLELIDLLEKNKSKSTNKTLIWVDLPESEQNKDKSLPIDPYTLGVIIGDGCVSSSIVISHPDEFIMNKIKDRLPDNLNISIQDNKECLTYRIVGKNKGPYNNDYILQLRLLDLMFKRSYEKFIPDIYLNSSHTQRLELIQGLMDTDGTVSKIGGTVSYCTTSYILAKQVQYLIRSIGGIASISEKKTFFSNKNNEKISGRIAYQVNIRHSKPSELFSLPRKKERTNDDNQYSETLKIGLSSIVADGFEEAQCISIDHPDHLYVTDDFIVTHNTSLFNELTPLPSDKNNFINGKGYKEIHIEKDKQMFRLISDFTDGVKYYFYLDDENLNASHNVTTQRELVFMYFCITPTIHDILIGVENFTDMSLLNRKKLFNSITHLNIDSVIENYNKLKEEHKNNEFLLKTQISLCQAEEQKLINKDHLENLLVTQKNVKTYIDQLLDIRAYVNQYVKGIGITEASQNYLDIQEKIQEVVRLYYTYMTSYPTDERDRYRAKLEIIDFKLNEFYTLLESKQKEINILNLNKQHDLKTLKTELEKTTYNRMRILKGLNMFTCLDRPIDYFRNDILKLEVSLMEIIRTIPLNQDKKFSKEKYERLLNRKQEALSELNKSITREAEVNKDMQHLAQHKENVICPNCSHVWSPLDSDTNMKNLKIEHKKLLETIAGLQAELSRIDKDLTELLEYFAIYKQYATLRNATYDNLRPFWERVDKNEYIFNEPNQVGVLFRIAAVEIEHLAETHVMYNNIQEMTKNIEVLAAMKDNNLEQLQEDIEEINDEISGLLAEKDELKDHIRNNDIAVTGKSLLYVLRNHLEIATSGLKDANMSYTAQEVLNVIESELSKYKVVLIETEREINNYNNIKYTIDKYRKTIDDIQSNIKVLEIILAELSPKNGLIAKSVSSFLNIIIENVNAIIGTVWDYKMVLRAINVEDEVLNYKFKVDVEDKITIEDIAKVSSGMKEIINLSFKTLLYKLLKLENYPVFLDEFGVKLDKVHRSKISELVFKMMNSNYYSQIFLITHIETSYAIFKDVEVLELG